MKNTREQRESDKITHEDANSFWRGGCKYWKKFHLNTSRGDYKGIKTKQTIS